MVCVLFVVLIYGMLTEDGHLPLYTLCGEDEMVCVLFVVLIYGMDNWACTVVRYAEKMKWYASYL